MSDSNRDEILSDFTAVTGVAEDRAKFYLESANWNLQVTINVLEYVSACPIKCKSVRIYFLLAVIQTNQTNRSK